MYTTKPIQFLIYLYLFSNTMDLALHLPEDQDPYSLIDAQHKEDSIELLSYSHKSISNQEQESSPYIEHFLDFYPISPLSRIVPQPAFVQEVISLQMAPKGKTHKIQKNKNKNKNPRKRKGKANKSDNSPFHNYQKHLNNALKGLLIVPQQQDVEDQPHKLLARQIWRTYQTSEIKTKRILHFIFNENNEHKVNEPQLKTYGLLSLYHQHGQTVFNAAKNYLSKLAIDQIDQYSVSDFLKSRKIRNRQSFMQYMLSFRQQLQNGYLKRRLTPDQYHDC